MLTSTKYKLKPKIADFGDFTIPNPKYGDFNLNLHPLNMELPIQFDLWEDQVNEICNLIPFVNNCQHFVTITSKFFTEESSLRREGIHIDGNFCADPDFSCSTWGGTTTTWAGTSVNKKLEIKTKFVSPYGITPPLGTYVSANYGGIFVASSYGGCDIYEDEIECYIGDEGSLAHDDRFKHGKILKPNRLYFISSDTPHSSLPIPQSTRRTLIRVTLDHKYPNRLIRE